ncbi:MAG: chorismate mutase [Firmicutes bacterium]|nr:chorismate mutase [Bacillota bacterium]
MIRGIRGATTVERDDAKEILDHTRTLIVAMAEQNHVDPEAMSSICFTLTPDLNATFPAEAARLVGWRYVPVICMRELDVPHGLPKTIRVLMHAELDVPQAAVQHVYLERAVVLREDLASQEVSRDS